MLLSLILYLRMNFSILCSSISVLDFIQKFAIHEFASSTQCLLFDVVIGKSMQKSMDHLPDELLISLVSQLSVKERTRTSDVARRWRNLWKFMKTLNLDDSELCDELRCSHLEKRIVRRNAVKKRFVKSVNGILIPHLGETIDELRIKSGLDNNDAKDVDRWIELALRKRVQKLELDFKANTVDGRWNSFRFRNPNYLAYKFPNVERFNDSPLGLSLVSLYLNQVDLTREILESLISNCLNLEHLHIERAYGLESLFVSCLATRLRHLAFVGCKDLTNIEICSPNLVSYELVSAFQTYAYTKLNGVSSLTHLSLAISDCVELFKLLGGVSGCLSRLETLKLHTVELEPWRMQLGFPSLLGEGFEFPSLPSLRRLVLKIDRNVEPSILFFTPLISSAPLLSKIVLKLIHHGCDSSRKPERAEIESGKRHDCLKVLEIERYVGRAVDVEMALYVMDYAALLEKVVINGVAHTGEDLHLLKSNFIAML